MDGDTVKPGTRKTCAPCACICSSLPAGTCSFTTIAHLRPYLAEYAARADPVFPEEVATHAVAPTRRSLEISPAIKRSLYDPEGLQLSSLKNRLFSPNTR